MVLRFRLERNADMEGGWTFLLPSASPVHPSSLGLTGKAGERLRWRYQTLGQQGETVEVWQWSERVPVNPGDLQCTDFVAGWKLIDRKPMPTPSSDELSHFFVQDDSQYALNARFGEAPITNRS